MNLNFYRACFFGVARTSHTPLIHCYASKDGSPPKKVAESKPEEQPIHIQELADADEAVAVVEEMKEDPAGEESKPSGDPAAEPVVEKKAEKTVEAAAAGAAVDLITVATQ